MIARPLAFPGVRRRKARAAGHVGHGSARQADAIELAADGFHLERRGIQNRHLDAVEAAALMRGSRWKSAGPKVEPQMYVFTPNFMGRFRPDSSATTIRRRRGSPDATTRRASWSNGVSDMPPAARTSRPSTSRNQDLPGALAALALAAVVLGIMALHAQIRADSGPGTAERTVHHGGRQRTYIVHDFGRGTAPAPVVIVLHGGGGNAENAVRMTGFDRIAARDGIIAVYPDGTARVPGIRFLTWNAGHCCAAAMEAKVDDVGFIGAIIDALVSNGRADASRVYVTGCRTAP